MTRLDKPDSDEILDGPIKAFFRALLDRNRDEPCPSLGELQKPKLVGKLNDHLAWCRHCADERGQYLAEMFKDG